MRGCRITLLTVLAALALAGRASAGTETGERLLSFNSDITVRADASMLVRETIRVHSTGSSIRHGIYRDFPTRYKDPHGRPYVVGFEIREVTRDGRPEPWRTSRMKNGVRVYIGDKDRLLQPGDYTFTISYETNWQLGFFADHDELYWNVTGNGWAFPIDYAAATVRVEGLPPSQVGRPEAYTGPQGARGGDYTAQAGSDGVVRFATTAPLALYEGLTIVVPWPKGFVRAPTAQDRLLHLARSDWGSAVGALGVLIVLGYYLVVWLLVGNDPPRGIIIPRYEPPKGLSPAAARFVWHMGFDNRAFAAALIDMAVKGYLSIKEDAGKYTILREQADGSVAPAQEEAGYAIVRGRADTSVLSAEEKKIAGKLLGKGSTVKLEPRNHSRIKGALEAARNSLRSSFEKRYFLTNKGYFVPGLLMSLAVIVLTGAAYASGEMLIFALWLSFWSVGVVVLVASALAQWRTALSRGGRGSLAGAVGTSLFALPFVAAEVVVFCLLVYKTSYWVPVILLAMVGLNCFFYYLLKAPTLLGREVLDELEGFRMFLTVADKDRLNLLNPPERTPELFEACLPYALALGVEQQWSQQFSDVLAHAGARGDPHRLSWYSGTAWSATGMAAFASSLGSSLGSAVAASSTAPGSSSGGGGGGSSGGGGGGGGGGGW